MRTISLQNIYVVHEIEERHILHLTNRFASYSISSIVLFGFVVAFGAHKSMMNESDWQRKREKKIAIPTTLNEK